MIKKALVIILLQFIFTQVFANVYICEHQSNNGQTYILEFLNGSFCFKYISGDGVETKYNLMTAPSPQEINSGLVYRDDERSFRLQLSHIPTAGNPASGQVVHTNPDGEVIQENMSTFCVAN